MLAPPEKFLIAYQGKQFGPCTLSEINYYLATHTFDRTATVWRQGWPQWRPASEVLDELMPAVDQDSISLTMLEELCGLLGAGLNKEKLRQLEWRHTLAGLRDTVGVRVKTYRICLSQARRFNDATPETLQGIAELLELPADEVERAHSDLVIAEWEDGLLPTVTPPPVPLKRGEVTHFVFPDVWYCQERTVLRRSYGGPSISFRVARGVYVRTGSLGGASWNESEIVEIGVGDVILTSHRFIYSSRSASFSLPFTKLLNVSGLTNGLVLVKDSSAASNKPFIFRNKISQRMLNAAAEVMWSRTREACR